MIARTRESIETFKNKVKGHIIRPGDSDYDDLRKIWNAMIDRQPAMIVQCVEPKDVLHTISYARSNGLEISVRGGGHNIAGSALCDGGVMIDFSQMKKVRVDERKKRAFVEPGASLADFDENTQAYGLTTPTGINSTTGIAGLTLGGGFGWLTRKMGMTVDNLISANMVTAEEREIRVSEDENSDLFWAIRGGGGNFGVVTQFEFALHAMTPEVLAGLLVFPLEQAKQVFRRYRQLIETAPEELNVWAVLRKAPPLPFLPQEVHGKGVMVLPVFYLGDPIEGEKLINIMRGFGDPYGEHIGVMPFVNWQKAFDPLLTAGARNYWKSHNFTELKDGAIDKIVEFAGSLPSPQCEIFMGLIAGAANRVPSNAMAYAHRDARFVLNVHGRWDQAADDTACIEWARAFFEAAAPYASAGAYVNFMTGDESARVASAYGANYRRLQEIKRKYDPDNMFRNNQNIRA
ncbi:MAG: FAD-linked oxidase [Desulfatitalea sp. BRH_c12]|nr:MAG: FAD-linked oxidase [Desulfatitalea sp. BRH_c12]